MNRFHEWRSLIGAVVVGLVLSLLIGLQLQAAGPLLRDTESAILAGILIGLLFAVIGRSWRQKLASSTILPITLGSLRYRRSEGNSLVTLHVLFGGLIFFVLSYAGRGIIFGIDISSNGFPSSGTGQFINASTFWSVVLGLAVGLSLGGVGLWFAYGIGRGDRRGCVLAFFDVFIGLFFATALSVLALNRSPLLPVTVVSHAIGILVLRRLAPNRVRILLGVLITMSVLLLPLMAYLAGGRV